MHQPRRRPNAISSVSPRETLETAKSDADDDGRGGNGVDGEFPGVDGAEAGDGYGDRDGVGGGQYGGSAGAGGGLGMGFLVASTTTMSFWPCAQWPAAPLMK